MYERNAIVLERYFYNLFKYNENSNLKENFNNYCNLVDCFEKFKNTTEEETNAINEFEKATSDIKKLQKLGEKLYNKSAKLEYSRYIIFENIEEETNTIKRCIEKIEKDVDKNIAALKDLDEEFISCLEIYKNKKEKLFHSQEENKNAKKIYEESLNQTQIIYQDILEEDINLAKEFVSSENKDRKRELINILIENGINEKNSFDTDVISNSVNVAVEIYMKEIEIFLTVYERTKKLLSEIEENDVKLDKHKKLISDSKVRIEFLNAEKDYIVGFLDNERITAIYDKKIHRKLMLEACKNFESDLVHINSLYDIILKEIASRSSKRLYKENYDISYLSNIKMVSENAEEEFGKLKVNSVAVMNLDYWRIDGISKIQEIFEKNVKEVFGRNLDEIFPKEELVKEEITVEEEKTEKSSEIKNEEIIEVNNEENISDQKKSSKILKSSKKNLENVIDKKRNIDSNFTNLEETAEVLENSSDDNEDEDSTYDALFEKISKLDELDEEEIPNTQNAESEKDAEEDEDSEESILDFYFKKVDAGEEKRKLHDIKKLNKDDDKANIFKKLIGLNSKNKKEA